MFTHDECWLNLNLDKDSNTGVSVVYIDNLKGWIYSCRKSLSHSTEDKIVGWFNDPEISFKLNRHNKKDDMIKIVRYLSVGISLLIAVFDGSGVGFIVFLFAVFIAFVIYPLQRKYNKVDTLKYSDDHEDTVTNPIYSSLLHNIFHSKE